MTLLDFLLELSTDSEALGRFKRDPNNSMEEAGLSESEKDSVTEGDVKKLRSLIFARPGPEHGTGPQVLASNPPVPGPTPPPEPDLFPHEPIELTPGPPPEPPTPEIIEPAPEQEPELDVDVDEATNATPVTWNAMQLGNPWEVKGLTVVGLGIRAGLQTTPEVSLCITQASKVLYLVADPIAEAWLQRLNPNSESLGPFYQTGRRRCDIYDAMVGRILQCVREYSDLCVVLYGHPGVLAYPAREAIRRARAEGISARMLPGLSTEDNLFADLGLDIGSTGLQSYEVTRFLLYKYRFDPAVALILWQVGVLGETRWNPPHSAVAGRLKVLAEYLKPFYGAEHEVFLYHAPEIATGRPAIESLDLSNLTHARTLGTCTLFVPPKGRPTHNPRIAEELGIEW